MALAASLCPKAVARPLLSCRCIRRAKHLVSAVNEGTRESAQTTITSQSERPSPSPSFDDKSPSPQQPPVQQSPAPLPASQGDQPDSMLATLAGELSGDDEAASSQGTPRWVAGASLAGVVILLGGGYLLKDQIKVFLEFFIDAVDDWGTWGYVAYALVYIALEVLALPAIPLTMTAGVIFGTAQGTIITSLSGTIAAAIAFLIARYAMRDKVRKFAERNRKFQAIDKAIGRDGLKFVTLLRLSPLLPLAASNYLYGLTSVDLGSYMLGSWIGMLPGTYAYVHAGYIGRAVFMEGEGSLPINAWQVGLGLGATLLALGFVGQLAKKAVEEVDKEEQQQTMTGTGEGSSRGQGQQLNGKGSSSGVEW